MEKQVLVSIAIKFYNQGRYIEETLSSVLKQKTNFDYEIVIGEDCSTDNSRSILTDFKQKYPERISLIFNEKNLGPLLNEKSVLDHCKGKYVALLDGDDLFSDENKLQKQYDYLENNPQYGLVHSDARVLIENEAHKATVVDSSDDYFHRDIKTGYIFEHLLLCNYILPCTVFFRRQLYIDHNDFETWHKLGFVMQDTPMLFEFSKFSEFGYIKEPLSTYRVIPNSVSRPKTRLNRLKFYGSDLEVSLYFNNKYGVSNDLRSRLLDRNHLFNLEYGFESKNDGLVLKSIEYFKNTKKMKRFYYLYYWGSKSVLAWYMLKILRKFFTKLRINYYC